MVLITTPHIYNPTYWVLLMTRLPLPVGIGCPGHMCHTETVACNPPRPQLKADDGEYLAQIHRRLISQGPASFSFLIQLSARSLPTNWVARNHTLVFDGHFCLSCRGQTTFICSAAFVHSIKRQRNGIVTTLPPARIPSLLVLFSSPRQQH